MEPHDMLNLPDAEFRVHVIECLKSHSAAIDDNTSVTKRIEEKVDKSAEDTAFIRSILGDVAAGARLMCRLAAAWRLFIRQMVVPIGLPLLALYVLALVAMHHAVPEWAAAIFKLLGG